MNYLVVQGFFLLFYCIFYIVYSIWLFISGKDSGFNRNAVESSKREMKEKYKNEKINITKGVDKLIFKLFVNRQRKKERKVAFKKKERKKERKVAFKKKERKKERKKGKLHLKRKKQTKKQRKVAFKNKKRKKERKKSCI